MIQLNLLNDMVGYSVSVYSGLWGLVDQVHKEISNLN